MDDRVHRLTDNLQGTTRNLRSLDRMLDSYRDVTREQRSSVDRLRDEVARTHDQVRRERARSPSYRDYGSDSEFEGSPTVTRRRRKRSSTVRFADDMNRELHTLNNSLRDLSNDHIDLGHQFQSEVGRRERSEYEARRTMKDISETLKKMPHEDPVASRVERRLNAIQNELQGDRDRHAYDRYDELLNLSTDLRQALNQNQHYAQQAADERVRNQYLQSEANKIRVESDLDNLKRKLDQSEGGKVALQAQVDELRSQLHRIDNEKGRLKQQMDDSRYEDEIRERRKKRSVEEEKDRDRRLMERELQELRGQLTRSISASSEMEELRRGIERSERQRVQLSDHIETLTKDLDNREKQAAKLITQLKEMSDKFEASDRQKNQLQTNYDDSSNKVKEVTKDLEKTTNELRNTQLSLHESEKKKDEFKARAQETVRQWKMKVKQLEREVDRHKHGANQLIQRNEQLVKDLESHRHQLHHNGMQMENMKRELGDALAVRAAQDEQIRIKDVELNELKSVRIDMDREVRDSRTIVERMENELNNNAAKLAAVTEERNRIEDRMSSLEAAHLLAQDQANQLQHEIKELSSIKAEIAAKLSESNGKLHDLKQNYIEMQHREKAARDEAKLYQRQLHEERENHQEQIESVKQELSEVKVREAHVMQDIQRKMKRGHAEYEATIQTLKMELSEEKSAHKISKRNDEKNRMECEKLTIEMVRYEEENGRLMRKLEKIRQEYETQGSNSGKLTMSPHLRPRRKRGCLTQMAESDISRVKRVEEELFSVQNDAKRFQANFEGLLHDMVAEIDSLMEITAVGTRNPYQPVASSTEGPNATIAEAKTKMKWLRSDMRNRLTREQKLRNDLRDAINANENDRQYLLSELAKREDVLDELSVVKHELSKREFDSQSAVENLKDHILDLTDEIELRKIREEEIIRSHVMDKKHIIDEMDDLKHVQEEKARIENRYLKLQDTMRALQDEIQSANFCGAKITEIENNMHNLRKATPKKKRVRIQDTSRSRSKSPLSRAKSPLRPKSPLV
ncbi:centrosomal protein of 128 kDa-like isoform X2 [Mytilus californianus]|uniref:centrosomal protein of 128 kDa-like isoform X2 n=1 Tax=Mytilus californianus TaxID=6549 RepID=UPI0022460C76|nr:centrosomal protein of 128 kDa-like isoform X2 [Mytilus californianus]